MSHSAEGLAFLTRLNALPDGPGVALDDVLGPSLADEQELRKLFAQDKANPRLDDPYVGLVDLDEIPFLRYQTFSLPTLSGQYIMPLQDNQRRKDGDASMVADFDEFGKNWSIFTEGSLSQLINWNNVIAAGGSVLSALLPLSDKDKENKRTIRKYYHSAAFPASDVDLFLWGLTPDQAEKKIVEIYEAVRDSIPWDVTCIRTKHTISIHSQYPYRSVQIVLRLYRSPAEVLAGFDIDAPCCAYDGEHVWANPRAITAMIRQCNTVDVSRRSPSYEIRLEKYAKRGFEVYVPNLKREDVDPTIYERSIVKIQGLARLLVLEKLGNSDTRQNFLQTRNDLRGRPNALRRFGGKRKRNYQNDLKTVIGGLEMNDYDVASLHIPYGPGWDARKIEKLVYQTDLGMNSTFNPKNKGRRLHRHPAFFGTIEECMDDCCQHCPEPIDEDERNLQKQEDEMYVRGRIAFIEENPGRQSLSGSFNPIDDGEWSEQVYVRPIQKLFSAIASHDIALVRSLLAANKSDPKAPDNDTDGINLQHRDHVGRTALHLAILVKAEEIAKLLVDEGCRMIARLVDGRTALHLAAQYGLEGLIEKMFEKSKQNQEDAEKKAKFDKDEDEEMKDESSAGPPDSTTDTDVRRSSEDDWSSDDKDGKEDDSMDVDGEGEGDGDGEEDYDNCDDDDEGEDGGESKPEKADEPKEESPEDSDDDPDVLDVNAADWDQRFTPLCYAVLYGTSSTVSLLLRHKADPTIAADSSASIHDPDHVLPLFLTLIRPDEDTAATIAEILIEGGASSSAADPKLVTVLHKAVFSGKTKILDLFLRKDPGAQQALDFPIVEQGVSIFPVVSAVAKGGYAELLTLLAYGAKINPSSSNIAKAKLISGITDPLIWGYAHFRGRSDADYMKRTIETAICQGEYSVDLLLEVGADANVGTSDTLHDPTRKQSILDWVVHALEVELPEALGELEKQGITLENNQEEVNAAPKKFESWKEYLEDYQRRCSFVLEKIKMDNQKFFKPDLLKNLKKRQAYLQHVRGVLELAGAKTWKDIKEANGDSEEDQTPLPVHPTHANESNQVQQKYRYLSSNTWRRLPVPEVQYDHYDELFEAAFKGDDANIERLCTIGAHSNATPLRVTVETRLDDNKFGPTPLYAAIVGKRWATAKLIIGIAAAQYRDENAEDKDKLKAALFDLVDGQEFDDGEDDGGSCHSEETADPRQRQSKFIDIAKKISLRTDAHPSLLVNAGVDYTIGDENHRSTLLAKAVKENDFNAFIHLFDIQESVDKKVCDEHGPLSEFILGADNPKFLDELIRRMGVGIDVETARKTTGDVQPIASNDQNRLYLGLNIHGQKRADLARKGDPNASQNEIKHLPLVWRAVAQGAKSILEYLSSDKPLLAYKYFATNGDGDKAEWLRHSKSLESSLTELLGWRITPLGESPLTMAAAHRQVEVLPVLFSKAPKLMGSALHQKWNIYHWLCYNKANVIVEYLLERLPQDVNEELLARKSKGKLTTPLHVAVKSGSINLVKTILAFTKDGLLVRDALGFMPLHHAIRCGFVLITEEILKVIPTEGLYIENGVGKTPLEDAQKRAMKPTIVSVTQPSVQILSGARNILFQDDIEKLEKESRKVMTTLDRLKSSSTVGKGSSLANAFEKFVSATEGRLAKIKAQNQETLDDNTTNSSQNQLAADPIDSQGDHIKTLTVLEKAISNDDMKRTLVHLRDVQRSVASTLEGSPGEESAVRMKDEFEEEEKHKEKAELFAFDSFTVPNDS
ncbi:hypothetical protein AGABI2DRAFT_181422 [Agaricus bisporus var. bisporus H97]|uniref:hypothetical protein n=1 Tax=Agaricus bisporus var. bisporus (strain H97 / ATCC MYA-4626 / FGSC 10389) TaxID=936046 RepID=UPI00029F76B7|nr:hypothetical protein AGABI2DRAFT_181422 [Agaricus bisporus var. bisporus H97]EKV42207.1 hypothetical protein AGABI2DRAFT_181422 [Agaricus bisporus var. bisporus H97]